MKIILSLLFLLIFVFSVSLIPFSFAESDPQGECTDDSIVVKNVDGDPFCVLEYADSMKTQQIYPVKVDDPVKFMITDSICQDSIHFGYDWEGTLEDGYVAVPDIFTNLDIISHSISSGVFIGLCHDDYAGFDIFFESSASGTLLLTVPKDESDIFKRFDYFSCNYEDYTINGNTFSIITAKQVSQTDTTRTIKFIWDATEPVYQISYFKDSVNCINIYENNDIDPSESLRPPSKPEKHNLDMCMPPNRIHLNHTITNGTLKGVCSFGLDKLQFEIESDDDGVLFLDIPKDVFDRKYYYGNDGIFNVDVFSTKYTTYDDRIYVDRFYFPPVFEENTGIRQSYDRHANEDYIIQCVSYDVENDVCLKLYDESLIFKKYDEGLTFEEYYDDYKNKMLKKTPEIEHLIVTKIKTTDTFDRYKIPFLKDDYFFTFSFEQQHSEPVGTTQYNPQKYTIPIQQISQPVGLENNNSTTENPQKSLCKADLNPVSKQNVDRVLCVKDATAEKLENRGWILLR